MTTPLFSVVIPTYNRWPFVAEAVQSVLDQTLPDVEVVIVDDGSTDGTAAHLRARFPSVRVETQRNAERGAARNLGVLRSSGRYVMFLDSDDRFEPHHCAVAARVLEATPELVACATRSVLWNPDNDTTWPLPLHPETASLTLDAALWGSPVPIVNLAVRRDIVTSVGGFPEDREVAGSEDWVLVLRLLALHRVQQVDEVTVRIRQHEGRSMADPAGIVSSREAGTALLLRDGLHGRTLDKQQQERLRAGTAYFRAANAYAAGDMRGTRRALAEVRTHTRSLAGLRLTSRLWAMSLLGNRGALAVRRGRDLVSGRG